ncbi:MAG: class I SAM-dependent methyltransferase [Planctomycetaceae bacterium]|nr:class I SAM-dependent methyltransferase [Planctomycetales bacterium]MCB9921965.1 class I SAM-dependent methyltransferase [Planctomycetaceae bacterium]
MNEQQVGRFFDSLSQDYTAVIERCFPRYREMLWALLDYLPSDKPFNSIVELGSGTGNLSVLIARAFPRATIRFVDLSGDSLNVCRSRLGHHDRFTFEERDFRELSYEANSVDLVVSSIAVHHLTSTEKQQLFSRINGWLSPNGVFSFADQFRGATDAIYARHMHHWRELSSAAGSSGEEWNMWMMHQREHDHHDPLVDQLGWLAEAGFSQVDCVWRYLLWAVVQGSKQ